jgi:hypothetical protein
MAASRLLVFPANGLAVQCDHQRRRVIPLAQARMAGSQWARSMMALTRFSRPRPHIPGKQNWLICALTHQGHLGGVTRA